MVGLNYYVIDTETTGLLKIHEINEISIIRCSDRIQLTEFIKCEYPELASYDALVLTNKTIEDLKKGKSKEEVISKVDRFINEDGLTSAHRCFIAHNASFDKRFIHSIYDKVNKKCPVDLWLCTVSLTKQYLRQMKIKSSAKLSEACNIVGIKKIAGSHSSKADSRNTYLLWKNLVENKKIDYLPFIKNCAHFQIEKEILDFDFSGEEYDN